jgi:hypothetical protein
MMFWLLLLHPEWKYSEKNGMIRISPLPSGSPYFEDCGSFCPVLCQNRAGFSMPEIIALRATMRDPMSRKKGIFIFACLMFYLWRSRLQDLVVPAAWLFKHRAGGIKPLLTGPSPGHFMRR